MTEPPAAPSESPRILIAEDEPHIQRILITLFDARGSEWEITRDGAAALDAFRGDSRYDLVLLPPRHRHAAPVRRRSLDGPRRDTSSGKPARDRPDGEVQDADRERTVSLGADRFPTKPFSPRQLLSQIDVLLNRD